ncbi:hypothetical protein DEJ31_08895 [Curtobacterium sp. MCPF17_031]|nr:hypothetical protein DEJ31_08895 [Curtobacterium sp. MCPF17_031]
MTVAVPEVSPSIVPKSTVSLTTGYCSGARIETGTRTTAGASTVPSCTTVVPLMTGAVVSDRRISTVPAPRSSPVGSVETASPMWALSAPSTIVVS